jgi:eukaryotic-like serine/threonine-protein kinase
MSPVDPRLAASLADHYRLERELGAGGMATVYLAHDVKHDRRVAIKVLRPELAAVIGAARFLAEIKTTANLSHPHILPLHDSGEVDGTVFYVMPFVDGESLRDKLDREQQLPVDEAIRIAVEVAGALAYAHEHNVIHRDIKPENILLHGGHALVADFGIALAASRTDGKTRMTETGMSLGTPHYMSPEQAMGEREITARADVYALGCVLYEMLVGEPPFNGPTAQAIVARVMTEEPRSLTAQRRTIPRHVEQAVTRALSKLPADRFATAASFSEALTNASLTAVLEVAAPVVKPRRAWPMVATAVLLVAATISGFFGGRATSSGDDRLLFAEIQAADSYPALGRCCGVALAISPDGEQLVYVGTAGSVAQLFLRRFDRPEITPIPGTLEGSTPFFSPDGKWLGFFADGQMRKIALSGGPSVPIVPMSRSNEASWGTDGRIVYSENGHLLSVSEDGGVPDTVLVADTVFSNYAVSRIPGDRFVVFSRRRSGAAVTDASVGIIDLKDGTVSNLGAGTRALYANGHLIIAAGDNTLIARPFNVRTGEIGEAGIPIAADVMLHGSTTHEFVASTEGTLVFQRGNGLQSSGDELIVHSDGAATSVKLPITGYRNLEDVSYSPDGSRILIQIGGVQSIASGETWVFTPAQETLERLSVGGGYQPSWSRSGTQVAYVTNQGLIVRNADGTGEPRVVARGTFFGPTWLPDDRGLIFVRTMVAGGQQDLYRLDFPDTTPKPVLATNFIERQPQVSPDGQWLAYTSNLSGTAEVYVQPFTTDGPRVRVSNVGGSAPRWSPDGRTLYYVLDGSLIAAARAPGAGFSIASRTPVIASGVTDLNANNSNWSVHPDGKSFLYITFETGLSDAILSVVRNWPKILEQRATR